MSEKRNSFSYTYSGAVNDELEHFKEKYTPKKVNEKIKKIRALDKNVDFISTMLSITTGLLGSALIIIGVIWLIKDFYSNLFGGLFTFFGIMIIAATPFLYFKIHSVIKAYYSPEILALIKEIEQNQL